jgi:hypothetical protein
MSDDVTVGGKLDVDLEAIEARLVQAPSRRDERIRRPDAVAGRSGYNQSPRTHFRLLWIV